MTKHRRNGTREKAGAVAVKQAPLFKSVRKTISFDLTLWECAQEQMREDGFGGNFSALVADLVRKARDARRKGRRGRRADPGGHSDGGSGRPGAT